ncbi:MAG: hypothetical protein ABFD54_01340 [Armatimonadota bacterium]|nr:hypothetical protein [bacterium]
MRRITLLVLALTLVISVPSMAGRITSTALTHFFEVYQVAPATSVVVGTDPASVPVDGACVPADRAFLGYLTEKCPDAGPDVITAAPGILAICPGENWGNYVAASQAGVPYFLKNTTLVKQTPEIIQCADVFPQHRVTQQGTPNIRLWWPLLYEVPSTTFTLNILYGTQTAWDDDGVGVGNPAAWVHAEQWVWHVDANLSSLSLLLDVFHELPFGKYEVPLISDEALYFALKCKVAEAADLYEDRCLPEAAEVLADFELEVMDACIGSAPGTPAPGGLGTGIANTDDNPACCKLLADVEYIFQTTGIAQPSK